MSAQYQLPRGAKHFLPEEAYTVTLLENKARTVFAIYGYRQIRLPIIENKNIFIRSLGENSDIVDKQIFNIEGKYALCLRPEATAQIARSYIEHNLYSQKLVKLFYIGAMFRGERPQKGRFRQFHHIGAEAIGQRSPYLDAELMKLANDLLLTFGICSFELEVNSLGCKRDVARLEQILLQELKGKSEHLCENCKRRLKTNTLRVLDCKNASCRDIIAKLCIGMDYLCGDCKSYFDSVLKALDSLSIKYRHVHTLVRGLDYYTQTVFEFTSSLLGSQNAIGAGGRYDGLVKELGGQNAPACGFALGLERILLLRGVKEKEPPPTAFIAYVTENLQEKAFKLLNNLRQANVSCDMDFNFSSLKSQLRYCQKLRATFAVILGEDELSKSCVMVRDMQKSKQETVKIDTLISYFKQQTA